MAFTPALKRSYRPDFLRSVRSFQDADTRHGIRQVAVTLGGVVAVQAVMMAGLHHHHGLAVLLAPLAAGLLVRTFILQHDCGHGSLFADRRANRWVGRLCSLFTFTPYDHWRAHHAIHHGSWNNLSTRGRLSDIYSDCITTREYYAMSSRERLLYRLSKHPVIALLVMPPIIFLAVYRIPFDSPRAWRRERVGVHLTTLGIVLLSALEIWLTDWRCVALTILPTLYIASVVGVWLFVLQHKFEGAQWRHAPSWDFVEASIAGCSLLRLPSILEWFSGHIGYHHIHHVAPGVPNYRLKDCHAAHAEFGDVKVIGLSEGLREILRHELWDDDAQAMVAFSEVLRMPPRRVQSACAVDSM